MIIFLLLCIFDQISFGNFICTLNPKYGRTITSIHDIELCESNDCATSTKILTNNKIYHRCRYSGNTKISNILQMKIEIYAKHNSTHSIPTHCIDKDGAWKKMQGNFKCDAAATIKFVSYQSIGEYDVYVVTCEDQQQEFPDQDRPRIQIVGLDFHDDVQKPKTILAYQSERIECITNCNEHVPKWSFDAADDRLHIINQSNILIIKTDKMVDTSTLTTNYHCEYQGRKKSVNFAITEKYDTSLTSYTEGKIRYPSHRYDAGELISCRCFGYFNLQSNKASVNDRKTININQSVPIHITLLHVDNNGQIIKSLQNGTNTSIEIPNNFILDKGRLSAFCYFGKYGSQDIYPYYQVAIIPIEIGAKILTKLTIGIGGFIPTYREAYDFKPNDQVQCDRAYYQNVTGYHTSIIPLYVLYASNHTYPMSMILNYVDKSWHNESSGIYNFIKPTHNKKIFMFCIVKDEITVPIQVYSGDRPVVRFVNIHPKWPTKYHLMGFSFYCQGEHVDEIALSCKNCLPDTRMEVTKMSANMFKLVIPKTLRKYLEITYQCIGFSTKYESVFRELNLKIIVSEITDFHAENNFFLYGADYLSCRSHFTVYKDSIAVKESIVVPAQLQIEGSTTVNLNGSLDKILIIDKNVPNLASNFLIAFQACCPAFSPRGYSCMGQWRTLYVAREYHVRYSVNLADVYPGNILRCSICMNYTYELKTAPCTGLNVIPSKLRMRVIYPDGFTNETDFQNEVRSPVEGLKLDRTEYFKISDYEVYVGCKSRGPTNWTRIYMKSCNLNPPSILINPPDKTMFVVGDIFSCTTESINCKNGLIYTIYVQRGMEPPEKKDSRSFTLTKKHTGNNIKISCVAGEGESSRDTRMIRVEIGPYNISINTIFPVMVYGQYLRCMSLGFPPPTITWTQLKGESPLRVSETFLLIGPWDFSGEYTIQCEAKNKRGSISRIDSFKIFNARITSSDYSFTFYLFIPLCTVIYLLLLLLSLLLIFQENVFGVPFFSSGTGMVSTKPKVPQATKSIEATSMGTTATSYQHGDENESEVRTQV